MSTNTYKVADWTLRMTRQYGGLVYALDGRKYDWGQALAVEQYGGDVDRWPDVPSFADVKRAEEWEAGDWPSWVDEEKTSKQKAES